MPVSARLSGASVKIAYTLFEISNASNLSFRYRLIKVREPLPDDVRQPIRLQKWADELWRRRLGCPVYPMRREKGAFFIVPADTDFSGVDLSHVDVPNVTYHADPTDEYREISLSNADTRELEFLARMLERPFSDVLSSRKQDFWQDTWTRFFRQQPENVMRPLDKISGFRGFAFSIVPIPPKCIYLAMDVVTRYVSRLSLAELLSQNRRAELFEHCDAPPEKRRWMLRDNGSVKHRCVYAGETGKSIAEFQIQQLGQTVLDYYRQKFPRIAHTLNPDEPAVYCARDKSGEDPVPAPASRLFPIFPFERGFRSICSVSPQLSPDDRQRTLRTFLRELGPVSYAGQDLQISDCLLIGQDAHFDLPALEFGQGFTLDVRDLAPTDGHSALSLWAAEKMRALMHVGPYRRQEYPRFVFFYPDGLKRATRERFAEAALQELAVWSGVGRAHFEKELGYSPDPHGHDLLVKAHELKWKYDHYVLIICILSSQLQEYVYNRFKIETEDVFSQCVREENLSDVTSRRAKRRNFALGVLMALGSKPWVLSTSLDADVHIGVDVLGDRVAYTFMYGPSGREIVRDGGHSGGDELIKPRLLREKLVAGLTRIRSAGYPINTFVVHRDGRWWPKETEALDEAVAYLQAPARQLLPPDARYAVAEIHKSHFPIRIFSTRYREGRPIFENPFPGCYLVLDRNRAVLTSTGRPSEWDEQGRTAGTMLVQIAHNPGHLKIEDVARDVFYLTQLNWSALDIEINAPVTIRWADDLLRELYIEPER
jgi:hypothetical protein